MALYPSLSRTFKVSGGLPCWLHDGLAAGKWPRLCFMFPLCLAYIFPPCFLICAGFSGELETIRPLTGPAALGLLVPGVPVLGGGGEGVCQCQIVFKLPRGRGHSIDVMSSNSDLSPHKVVHTTKHPLSPECPLHLTPSADCRAHEVPSGAGRGGTHHPQ